MRKLLRWALYALAVVFTVVPPDNAFAERYATGITGTVSDSYTALMWQRQPDTTERSWRAALAYCEGLTLAGFDDWRLPDVKELRSLIADTSPDFDVTAFPGTASGNYWSSTTRAGSPNFAWYVAFTNGVVYTNVKTAAQYVRCVR